MPTEKFERLDTARIAQIISVALEEFTRHSFTDASFNRIIRNCGMAKGTMYYYFRSKEDLFLTLYKATVREFTSLVRMAQRKPASADEYWILAGDMLELIWVTLRTKPQIALFVSNFFTPHKRQDGHPASETAIALDTWLQSFVRQGQQIRAVRQDLSPELLTSMIWSLWDGLRSWLPTGGTDRSAIQDPLSMLDLMERLLKPAPVQASTNINGFDLRPETSRL